MKIIAIKKKSLIFAIAMLLILCILTVGVAAAGASQVYLNKVNKKLPIYCVETEKKQVALTFDAAWGSDSTETILETLKEYDVKATFFLVGFWTEKHKDLVAKIDEQGIEIGTHSNTHPNMPRLSESKMRLELEQSCNSITSITNKSVNIFRAPFGDYSDKMLAVTESMNLKTIQWDVDTLDWKDLTAEQIVGRVQKGVKNGSIVLMHNDGKYTAKALPLIIEALKVKGYEMTTVGELVYNDNYIIDHTGKQIKNK